MKAIMRRKGLLIAIFMLMVCCFSLGFMGKSSVAKAEEKEESSGKVEVYMLAPENGVLMESFVIKTKNGKLLVFDGGTAKTEENKNKPYLLAALRAIAGVGENEYFEVDTWIISHAHGDHFYEMAKMLDQYTENSNYKVNNIYFDFPAEAKSYQAEGIDRFLSGLDNYAKVNGIDVSQKSYYDQLNGAFVNEKAIEEGLEITIDGVRIEFLQTYDLADGSNANEHSMVFRVHAEGQSILFLGDLALNGGARLLKTYGDELKSDMCQMAHHGQDGVAKDVYDAIGADVRFWATPIWVWNNPQTYQIGEVRSWVNAGVDFTESGECDIVACLYEQYPTDYTSVKDWNTAKDYMKVELPYSYPPSAPVISLESGTYYESCEVELKSTQENAKIYYTIDGSYPQVSAQGVVGGTTKVYDKPFTLQSNGDTKFMVVRAIAVVDGEYSKLAEERYFFTEETVEGAEYLLGYDESNWDTVNTAWTITDNVATIAQSNTWGNAHVFNAKKYKNFILEGEFSIPEVTSGHVGFQLYRTNPTGALTGTNGYCVLIENHGRVAVYDGVNGGAQEYGSSYAYQDKFNPAKFTFRVISLNDNLYISINGETVYTLKSAKLNRDAGYIALHTGRIGVSVSNLWIMELGDENGINDVKYGQNIIEQSEEVKVAVNQFDFKETVVQALPTSVAFKVSKTESIKVPVLQWTSEDYDRKVEGWYTFTGVLNCDGSSNAVNMYGLKATAKVFVSAGVDKTELENCIELAVTLDSSDFSAEGWSAFELVLQEALEIAEGGFATQAEIDEIVIRVEEKIKALVNINQDKSALNALLDTCTYEEDKYTATSFANYERALQNAREIEASNLATQNEINTAVNNLQTAISKLVALYDKTALANAVAEAKALDSTLYTAESFAKLTDAITQAESVLAMDKVSASVGELAMNDLQTAKANLKKVDDSSSGTTGDDVTPPAGGDENPDGTTEEESGCGSVAGVASVGVALVGAATAVMLKKKKED